MTAQPQRRAQRRDHLDASAVTVERALLERADDLAQLGEELPEMTTQRFFALGMAAEFRKLAEELHWHG